MPKDALSDDRPLSAGPDSIPGRPILLHVITALHTGGAERMLASLTHEQRAWADVHVACLKPNVLTLADRLHPATHLHVPPHGLSWWARYQWLCRLIDGLRPAAVHTHLSHADLLGTWASRGRPHRALTTLHNVRQSTRPVLDWLFRQAYRWTYRLAGRRVVVIAISKRVAREATTLMGMPARQIRIIYNPRSNPPADLPERATWRSRLGLPQEVQVIAFIGRLEPQKGLPYLLQAFDRLRATREREGGPPIVLALAGEGSMGDWLAKEAKARPGAVFPLGLLDTPWGLLAEADVLAVPSLYEGFGLVVLEGMASGMPVVASNIEGPAELIENEQTGLLCTPADPDALAAALSRVLNDPSLAERLGDAARQAALRYPDREEYARLLTEVALSERP